jgi:hypothetical protein
MEIIHIPEKDSLLFLSRIMNDLSVLLNDNIFIITPQTIKIKEDIKSVLGVFGYKCEKDSVLFSMCKRPLKRIKLLCNWCIGKDLCNQWEKMNNGTFIFTYENERIDYYLIINKPIDNDFFIPSKSIVFRMEPDTGTSIVWNDWYSDKKDFLYFLDLDVFRNNSEWHIDKTFSNLLKEDINKTKELSTVVSSLYFMQGHKFRIDFLKFIETKHVNIDIYGKDNKFLFKQYIGPLPPYDKNNGLIPYKYTIACENCLMNNYFTEKIIDAILSECLCFYWGCKNIDEFIDSRAYIRLDDNFETSMLTIQNSIKNNEWGKRINIIRQEKKRILFHLSLCPRIESLILFSEIKIIIITKKISPPFLEQLNREHIYRFSTSEKGEFSFNGDILFLFDYQNLCRNFIDHLCIVYRQLKSLSFDRLYLPNEDNLLDCDFRKCPDDEYIKSNHGGRIQSNGKGVYLTRKNFFKF